MAVETGDWRTPEAQLGRRLAAGRDGTIHESGKGRVPIERFVQRETRTTNRPET